MRLDWQHTLISLAGLAATSALAWHGSIDGQSAVLLIGGVIGVNAAVNTSLSQKPIVQDPPIPVPPSAPPAPPPPPPSAPLLPPTA